MIQNKQNVFKKASPGDTVDDLLVIHDEVYPVAGEDKELVLPVLNLQLQTKILLQKTVSDKSDGVIKALCTKSTFECRVSDLHHFNADPDPAFHFNSDPDPGFQSNSDPNPALHEGDANLRPLTYRSSRPSF
jgi:hypothetical protein